MSSLIKSACSRARLPLRFIVSTVGNRLFAHKSPLPLPSLLSRYSAACARPAIPISRAFSSSVPDHTVLQMPALSPTMTQVTPPHYSQTTRKPY
jgi:hypothetical protein